MNFPTIIMAMFLAASAIAHPSDHIWTKYENEAHKIERLPVSISEVVGGIKQGVIGALERNIEVSAELDRIKRQRKVEQLTGVPVFPRRARYNPAVSHISRIPYVAPRAVPYHKSMPLYPEPYPYKRPGYGFPY